MESGALPWHERREESEGHAGPPQRAIAQGDGEERLSGVTNVSQRQENRASGFWSRDGTGWVRGWLNDESRATGIRVVAAKLTCVGHFVCRPGFPTPSCAAWVSDNGLWDRFRRVKSIGYRTCIRVQRYKVVQHCLQKEGDKFARVLQRPQGPCPGRAYK